MARKRPLPSTSSEAPASGEGARGERPPPDERLGPLEIKRHVKDDGRALILYTHAEREHP
jgi:hypothetical protein